MVIVKTGFELRFTATKVVLGAIISFQRAAGIDSAIAQWCGVAEVDFFFSTFLICLEIRFVMLGMQL